MSTLSTTALVFGGALAALYAVPALWPGPCLNQLRTVHRNLWAGRVLSGIALVWAAILLHVVPLTWFDPYKQWLWAATPLVYLLVLVFMKEHLAARALGGLLLLIPAPILNAAFQEPSRWRLVLVVAAYVMVIEGLILVLHPHMLRKAVQHGLPSPAACRAYGMAGLLFGLFVVGLGLWVFF